MKESIKKKGIDDEFYTAEKCHITELCNSVDDPDVSIAKARVEPGITTNWHRLKATSERYCILSGIGVVEIGELPPQEVYCGDVAVIPPMCRQRITNTGTEDLIFLAICSPRFLPGNYEDIEGSVYV
jgi:mannose-6-phosphate isomerase-like protein (cupin superfamily)